MRCDLEGIGWLQPAACALRHEDRGCANESSECMEVQQEDDRHGEMREEADVHQKRRTRPVAVDHSVVQQREENMVHQEANSSILSTDIALRNCANGHTNWTFRNSRLEPFNYEDL